ncbi:MAG: hypothetical protein R3C25_10880 [Hyphomonadaceae bacterium]
MKRTLSAVAAVVALAFSSAAFATNYEVTTSNGTASNQSGAQQSQGYVPQMREWDGPTPTLTERNDDADRQQRHQQETEHREHYNHHETGETWHPSRVWDDQAHERIDRNPN